MRVTSRDYSYSPFGTYNFPAGPPGQNPTNFTQTFGAANVTYGETTLAAFAQDDFKISPRLSGNFGAALRVPVGHQRLAHISDRAPAWPGTSPETGRPRFARAVGVFYDQLYLYVYRRFFLAGPNSPQTSVHDPLRSARISHLSELAHRAAHGSLRRTASTCTCPPIVFSILTACNSLWVWNGSSGAVFVLTVDGIYAHTLNQYRVDDINHPAPFIRTAPGQIRSGAAADATRPFSTYLGIPVRDVNVIENGSSSLYAALDAGIRRKFGSRFQMEGHYVVSSSATYSMFYADYNSGIPNEWNNWGSAERAPSDFFQHHRLAGSGTVELPYGMRFGLVATAASGLPVNPLTGNDNNGDSYWFDRPVGLGRNSFRAPMQATLDVSLSKQIQLREKLRAETRFEFFNSAQSQQLHHREQRVRGRPGAARHLSRAGCRK